jgi:hypothetical protein
MTATDTSTLPPTFAGYADTPLLAASRAAVAALEEAGA